MRGFSLMPHPRALLAAHEAQVEHRRQLDARLQAALPDDLRWAIEAQCVCLLGKLRLQVTPMMHPGTIVFDRQMLTVRYSGDYASELLVGWIVGNLDTQKFLALWECR